MVSGKLTAPQGAMGLGALMLACAGLSLGGCASVAPMPAGLTATQIQNASTRPARQSSRRPYGEAQNGARPKLGAPYQAGGVWYVPAEQPNYDEVGLASWYGDQFNGKPTANGELFDMNGISAAHATLPMPSIVEVTNLENGRTLQVRLNDRGPFHPGRIIDLSRGAAQQLGFFNKGTAQVRVRFISAAPLTGSSAAATTIATNHMHALLPIMPVATVDTAAGSPAFSPVTTASASGFAVQAGAFSDRVNADRAASRLAQAGRTAVQPLDRNGSRLYRVTVGSWANAQDAGAARERVASMGFADARVVSGS